MKKTIGFYRPAAAAFLTMMAMALTSSALSFFLEPVCEALQINRGSFSLVFSLMSISGALANPFLGQVAGKKGVRGILLLTGLWGCGCMVLLSMARQLWMLYAAGFCLGLLGSTCLVLCSNVIVQQSYFGAQASGILGAVMAGSGMGGMIFSLIIPGCMEALGWRTTLRLMGACWLCLVWAAAMLLGKQTMIMGSGKAAVGLGMTRAEALHSPKLYLQMVVIFIVTACCGIQQQLPSLLRSQGFAADKVGVMISVMTAFLAIGKVVQGLLYGKLGIRKGGCLMLAVFAVGFPVMLLPSLAYLGLILLAFGMGVYSTLLPQVARRVFGSREYAAIWSLIATAGSVGTFVANPLWGTIYDLTGAYTLGQLVAPVLLMAAVLALTAVMKEET